MDKFGADCIEYITVLVVCPLWAKCNCFVFQNVWIKNGRPSILTDEFEEGNGFDLYIDGGRFLPDSVTVSKVGSRVAIQVTISEEL